MRTVILPALQNVLLPIMAAEKAKKTSARPGYTDPCAPPEPEPEEPASVLLSESVKQTTLLSEILGELKAIRASLSYRVCVLKLLLF
jgi:hypothetical protein